MSGMGFFEHGFNSWRRLTLSPYRDRVRGRPNRSRMPVTFSPGLHLYPGERRDDHAHLRVPLPRVQSPIRENPPHGRRGRGPSVPRMWLSRPRAPPLGVRRHDELDRREHGRRLRPLGLRLSPLSRAWSGPTDAQPPRVGTEPGSGSRPPPGSPPPTCSSRRSSGQPGLSRNPRLRKPAGVASLRGFMESPVHQGSSPDVPPPFSEATR